jgi:hypothetical protein
VARSGALLHMASAAEGEPLIARRDTDPWSEVARKSGGVLWSLSAAAEGTDEETEQLYSVLEHWARPTRIENLRVDAQGSPPLLAFAPTELAEGEELRLLGIAAQPAASMTLDGVLWAQPVHEQATRSKEDGERLSALVFGSELLADLTEDEMMRLALRGRAVSPVTSYLAIEPGVRPSTEGLEEGEVGLGMGGFGRGAGGGLARRMRAPERQDPYAFLTRELELGWHVCGGGEADATVTVETTLQELAAIDAIEVTESIEPDVLDCLRAAIWQIDLIASFDDPHARWTVAL